MNDTGRGLLTIAIPTYNRKEFLKKNLDNLNRIIVELKAEDIVGLLVSDNCSTDGTSEMFSDNIDWNIRVRYHKNNENIGPMRNTANLFGIVDTDYMLLLGDDDFISAEYLKRVLECLKEGVGCVIPSYINVDLQGNKTGRGRDTDKPSRRYEAGFKNCLENSWRGHQLSGLVFRVSGLADEIEKKNIYNYYLQIYGIAYCCLHGASYHITEYPVHVTRPPQKTKTWSYGEDGLIGHVFENYMKLDITNGQKFRLEMKFLWEQYWRYAMYLKRGLGKFFGCIIKIINSPNTVWLTKIVFGVSFLFVLIGKAFSLLFNGTLLRTLSTKVDI